MLLVSLLAHPQPSGSNSVAIKFTLIAHGQVYMMWCHGENLDGGLAEELRLMEGTPNVYVTTGRA